MTDILDSTPLYDKEPTSAELLEALQHGGAVHRTDAAERLGRLREVRLAPAFRCALADDHAPARLAAAEALARLGSEDGFPVILAAVKAGSRRAADLAARLGLVEAIPDLLEMTKSDDLETRCWAARGLCNLLIVQGLAPDTQARRRLLALLLDRAFPDLAAALAPLAAETDLRLDLCGLLHVDEPVLNALSALVRRDGGLDEEFEWCYGKAQGALAILETLDGV